MSVIDFFVQKRKKKKENLHKIEVKALYCEVEDNRQSTQIKIYAK